MPTVSQRLHIENAHGHRLAAILDRPDQASRGMIVFAHCFTCSKDLKAIVRICRSLRELGWSTLRFDFTGIGQSEGDFSQSNFDTNLSDLAAVCEHLRQLGTPADFIFGHSFGGAAATVVAPQLNAKAVASIQGVITLAAPSDTAHLADILVRMNPEIDSVGLGEVTIGGKNFRISKQMIDNFRSTDFRRVVLDARSEGSVPHLVIQSMKDATVDFSQGTKLYNLLRVPTSNSQPHDVSFLSMPHADHLLSRDPEDVQFVVQAVDLWCGQRVAKS